MANAELAAESKLRKSNHFAPEHNDISTSILFYLKIGKGYFRYFMQGITDISATRLAQSATVIQTDKD